MFFFHFFDIINAVGPIYIFLYMHIVMVVFPCQVCVHALLCSNECCIGQLDTHILHITKHPHPSQD